MKFSVIDRAAWKVLNDRILAAAKEIAAEHGVAVEQDNGHYSNGPDGDVKFKLKVIGENGEVMPSRELAFALAQYRLNTLSKDGKRRLVDYKARRHAYPFVEETIADGRRWKVPTDIALIRYAK